MPDASRPWRMIHRSITTSERLGKVSDSAFRLFTLLFVNQDDDGCYPWTPNHVRALISGTPWTLDQADQLYDELAAVQLVRPPRADYIPPAYPMLTIYRGAELNGHAKSGTRNWLKVRRYAPDGSTVSQKAQLVPRKSHRLSVAQEDQ